MCSLLVMASKLGRPRRSPLWSCSSWVLISSQIYRFIQPHLGNKQRRQRLNWPQTVPEEISRPTLDDIVTSNETLQARPLYCLQTSPPCRRFEARHGRIHLSNLHGWSAVSLDAELPSPLILDLAIITKLMQRIEALPLSTNSIAKSGALKICCVPLSGFLWRSACCFSASFVRSLTSNLDARVLVASV